MSQTCSTLPVGVPADFSVSLRRILVPTALDQAKAVANALGAGLVVTSSDYHHRFLSYLTHAENGILRVQGVPCPVVVVNVVVTLGTDMILVYGANGHYGTKPAARSRNIAACGGASSNPELHIQN